MLLKLKKGYGSVFHTETETVRFFDEEPLLVLAKFDTPSKDIKIKVKTVGKYSRPIIVEIWENWLRPFQEEDMSEELTTSQWTLIEEAVDFYLQHLMSEAELDTSMGKVSVAFEVMKLRDILSKSGLALKKDDVKKSTAKPESKNLSPVRINIDSWNGYEINFKKKEVSIWEGNYREGGVNTFAFKAIQSQSFKDHLASAVPNYPKHYEYILKQVQPYLDPDLD